MVAPTNGRGKSLTACRYGIGIGIGLEQPQASSFWQVLGSRLLPFGHVHLFLVLITDAVHTTPTDHQTDILNCPRRFLGPLYILHSSNLHHATIPKSFVYLPEDRHGSRLYLSTSHICIWVPR
ncbi:unnamed protein product [Somion occarium]|uniref:Uncharacterized protein n=1 Tax=Somion occarium TaxID=3059160 RepID=A0ABP1DJJ5_9APHY